MATAARAYFDQRRAEVNAWLRNASRAERRSLTSALASESNKLMKAATFLVLYSWVEATTRVVVDQLWDAVRAQKASAKELITPLRTTWVEARFRAIDTFSASAATYRDATITLVSEVFDGASAKAGFRQLSGGGNIDQHRLREMADKHGVNFVSPGNCRDGSDLELIKNIRNTLAHGSESFVDVGGKYTVQDLREMKARVERYLSAYVTAFERQLRFSRYLAR